MIVLIPYSPFYGFSIYLSRPGLSLVRLTNGCAYPSHIPIRSTFILPLGTYHAALACATRSANLQRHLFVTVPAYILQGFL